MNYSLAFSQSVYAMLFVADKIEQKIFDFISTQQIAESLNIPPSTTAMILRRLNRAGLIETREGANGGVRLARSPEAVTLLDLFLAVEQERPLPQLHTMSDVPSGKPYKAQQALSLALENARQATRQSLQSVTLRDLLTIINT